MLSESNFGECPNILEGTNKSFSFLRLYLPGPGDISFDLSLYFSPKEKIFFGLKLILDYMIQDLEYSFDLNFVLVWKPLNKQEHQIYILNYMTWSRNCSFGL